MNQVLKSLIQNIYEGIKTGELVRNGQLFTERELCERFSVKRGVIQKALVSLETLGIIEIRERQGIIISDTADKLLSDTMPFLMSHSPLAIHNQAFETRMILEPQAAYIAAQKCDAAKAEILESEIAFVDNLQKDKERKQSEKAELLYQHNIIFHNIVFEMTENEVMTELNKYISKLSRDIFSLLGRQSSGFQPYAIWPNQLIEEHRLIKNAIVNNEPDKAKMAMYDHLINSQKRNSIRISGMNQ